jgi:uncharacterized protein (TIGR02597 family)
MMKTPTKFIALLSGAALLASSAFAQGVVTNPVGYVTLAIKGTGGVGSAAYNFIGTPVHAASDFSGVITDSASANVIEADGATWVASAFAGTHYLQITSGVNEGISATISGNTVNSLTTVEDLSSVLAGTENFSIRKYTTISDVFGAANESGLEGGVSAAAADNILIQAESGFTTYYYKNGGLIGGTGWRSSSSPVVDVASTPIPFGTGLIVVRKQSADLSVVATGSVFPGDAVSPAEVGYNWKTSSIPVTLTIADYFGTSNEAGLTGGASAAAADNILIFRSTGGFDTYYYKNSGLIGGTGWRSSASPVDDQAATLLCEPGQMFIVNVKSGAGLNFTEVSPL